MKDNKRNFQLGNVLVISFAHLLHDIYSSFLAPILPLLIENLGISYSLAALLDVVRKIPSVLNPYIGIIADKICVKYFIIIAPTITAIVMSLLGAAPHYTAALILVFIMGISSTLFHVPAPVMIKQVSGERVGKGMSFYMLGGELARTLGPLTILGAISVWGLSGTWRLIPFGIAASIVLFIKIRKIDVTKIKGDAKKIDSKRKTLTKLIPLLITISGFIFFRSMMKSALTIFLPTFLNAKGDTIWIAGISLAVLQFAGALGTLMAGSISDKIGRKQSLLIIAVANPLLMWIFLTTDHIFVFPILVIMGFFLFANGPVLLALVQDTNSDRPAFVNGIYMLINFVLSSIAVFLTGLIGDMIGLEKTFLIAAMLSILSIPFVIFLPKTKTEGGL